MVVGQLVAETDVVVIGGGPGGYAAAIRLGQLGLDVTLIERAQIGGVCLNSGCIPSKSLIEVANRLQALQQSDEMGLSVESPRFDMLQWHAYKGRKIEQLRKGIEALCRQNHVNIVRGDAFFLAEDRIGVETAEGLETYRCKHTIIAAGSRILNIPGMESDGERVLNSTDILDLTSVPRRLLVLGAGYIGMEIGTAFAKLGSEVTLVEMADQVLPGLPPELVQDVSRNAKKLGLALRLSSKVLHVDRTDPQELHVEVSGPSGTERIPCDQLLVAVGRVPNTDGLSLDKAGVAANERGHIPVDEQGRTSNPLIFAIGDVTPGPALAHRATMQGIVAAEAIAGLPAALDTAYIPNVVFTDPEIATVGLTVQQANASGQRIRSGHFPFKASGRAVATNATDGYAQVVIDEETHLLLGMHAVGKDVSNLIGEGVLALEMSARAEDLALTIHPHPTRCESWMEAAAQALGCAIHTKNDKRE